MANPTPLIPSLSAEMRDLNANVGLRKIIHIDMDAFFASVEQRDNPSLKGLPIAVGTAQARGVVAAASYEARAYGVRSAMPSVQASRLCPKLIFCPPRFAAYRAVSQQIRAIFLSFTPLVEPLSLDEAYLDVTNDIKGIGSASRIAELIRQRIERETGLTASAGISYNKFLAKIASDHNKPNGSCLIKPSQGAAFVAQIPVKRFHGVGPKATQRMSELGIETGSDLRQKSLAFLQEHFGSRATYLYQAARGIDLRPVEPQRPRKSIGAERTFAHDLSSGAVLRETLDSILELLLERINTNTAKGRTITLKMRFTDFSLHTRAKSAPHYIDQPEQIRELALALLEETLPLPQPIRLMGLTLSNLEQPTTQASVEDGPTTLQSGSQLTLF